MGRVAGVFNNPPGFPCTPPGVDVLKGGKLTSNNVAGSSHDPLQSPAVASGAVSKPGGDAAGEDALHSAGVEGSEDAGARSNLPQQSQEEETLMCLLPALLPFGRSCYCSALCSLFFFFSQIFLRFLLQQISTALKQHIFWKKRTFCLPLPAVYIPETDKYSCLHSNR